jgi:hypothetical protein
MDGQEGVRDETPLTFLPLPTYGSAQLTGNLRIAVGWPQVTARGPHGAEW